MNGQLWGITAAAEEQADIIARHLNGDAINHYTGLLSMNILKMDGLHLCSLGTPEIPSRLSLLRSGQAPKPVLGKLVCSCNSLGEGNLIDAVKAGATEFGKFCQTTSAGTGCGSCKPEVKAILERVGKRVSVGA